MYQRLRFLSCIASVGLLLAGCGEAEKKSIAERETRVTLQPLEKRVFRHQIPVQGTVYPVEYAVLSAKISGTLELLKARFPQPCQALHPVNQRHLRRMKQGIMACIGCFVAQQIPVCPCPK